MSDNGRFTIVDNPDLQPTKLVPVSVADLLRTYPRLREPVVHGILRVGETANIIAPTKVGKSFLAGNLAWSVATGRPWLSHDVEQGKVLILDNELHPETLASRLTHIADEMQIPLDERDQVDVIAMRGRLTPVDAIEFVTSIEPGTYSLVVLDALYRTIPQGTSENDNAGMMAIYNHLDKLADHWQSAIVVVHHSSKGAQGDKALTDVGAGAGSISRAADTHVSIRPHEVDGQHVLEAVTRSFRSPEPVSVAFEWPLWMATTLAPEVKQARRQSAEKQKADDIRDKAELLDSIPIKPKRIQQKLLREKFEFGVGKFNRLIGGLVQAKQVKISRKTVGRLTFVYYSKLSNDSENDSKNDSDNS